MATLPNETQIRAAVAAQESINALLESWSDYAEATGSQTIPVVVVRAAVGSSDAALNLIRPVD